MKKADIRIFLTYLQSQETSQHYLKTCYEQLHIPDAATLSYQNANVFMYNLEHGNAFYTHGKKSDMLLQPILYFYGMVHLLKAALISLRPHYPESTKILAHGVSTRKRKKKQYSFLEDEVKIQHQGLFPYFSEHLFHMKQMPFEKITMHRLATSIPELQCLLRLEQQDEFIEVGTIGETSLTFPIDILDAYYITANAFIKRVSTHIPPVIKTNVNKTNISFELKQPITKSFGPFFIDHFEEKIYFPKNREHFIPVSEVMIHYLLLYNLSMLSRYESQWWGELLTLKPDNEFPLISHFLSVTAEKTPLLLGDILLNQFRNSPI